MAERKLSLHPMGFKEAVKMLSNTEPPPIREGSGYEGSNRTTDDASRSPGSTERQTVPRPKPSGENT